MTGDRMLQVPSSTGSAESLVARTTAGIASLGGSRAFDWINYDELGCSRTHS